MPIAILSLEVLKLTFFGHVILVAFMSPSRRPKRRPRALETPPRAPQEPPRGPQETPRAGQEGSRLSKIAPRGSQKASKTHKIAEVDVSQRPCPKSQDKKGGRAADPPRRPAHSAGTAQMDRGNLFFSIKISIVFLQRFLVDFGSSWGAILGSFSALLAAKMGQVRSKTRLGSVSSSKT